MASAGMSKQNRTKQLHAPTKKIPPSANRNFSKTKRSEAKASFDQSGWSKTAKPADQNFSKTAKPSPSFTPSSIATGTPKTTRNHSKTPMSGKLSAKSHKSKQSQMRTSCSGPATTAASSGQSAETPNATGKQAKTRGVLPGYRAAFPKSKIGADGQKESEEPDPVARRRFLIIAVIVAVLVLLVLGAVIAIAVVFGAPKEATDEAKTTEAPPATVKLPVGNRNVLIQRKDAVNGGMEFTFDGAKQFCEKKGGRLLLPRSEVENDMIVDAIEKQFKKYFVDNSLPGYGKLGYTGFFIDVRKTMASDPTNLTNTTKTQVWSSSDGTPIWIGMRAENGGKAANKSYTNWRKGKIKEYPGEPNGDRNSRSNEDCVIMMYAFQWEWGDIACDHKNCLVYACEKDGEF